MPYSKAMRCDDCKGHHYLDCVIPDAIWRLIVPEGDGIVLCPLCIDERCQKANVETVAEFYYKGEALRSRLYAVSYGDDPTRFVPCKLCGLKYPRAFSGDLSQCYPCHRLLNRLVHLPIEQARVAWESYQRAIDIIRRDDEPAPSFWGLRFSATLQEQAK